MRELRYDCFRRLTRSRDVARRTWREGRLVFDASKTILMLVKPPSVQRGDRTQERHHLGCGGKRSGVNERKSIDCQRRAKNLGISRAAPDEGRGFALKHVGRCTDVERRSHSCPHFGNSPSRARQRNMFNSDVQLQGAHNYLFRERT